MFDDLGRLIEYIDDYYIKFNNVWRSDPQYKDYNGINFKRTLIRDINRNQGIYDAILKYRSLLSYSTFDFDPMHILTEKVKVSSRTKSQNSVLDKIDRYLNGPEQGKVALNKSLNDLFGIRVIFKEKIVHNQVKEYIEKNYKELKCIDSSNLGYTGTHIYFKKDNYTFAWELQVWCEDKEQANYDSHKVYKQGYLSWEKEYKGGVHNGKTLCGNN